MKTANWHSRCCIYAPSRRADHPRRVGWIQTIPHRVVISAGMKMNMSSRDNHHARFSFVSNCVMHAAKRCIPENNGPLKRSLQMNLWRIFRQEYTPAVCDLCCAIRETQSSAAYLLLAEAYAQAGQTEMAMATLDVLQCVKPDRSDAETMKRFLVSGLQQGKEIR